MCKFFNIVIAIAALFTLSFPGYSSQLSQFLNNLEASYERDQHRYRHHRAYEPYRWIHMRYGDPIPAQALSGGHESYPDRELYVCRGFYNGALHPGKIVDGRCNIGWGGAEVILNNYDILLASRRLYWISTSYGNIPANAIKGGYQQDGPLYICRARYQGSLHPGKAFGNHCNISWGGREIVIPVYDILAAR